MVLIQTVDVTNSLANIHLRQFLTREPAVLQIEGCRKAIITHVSFQSLRIIYMYLISLLLSTVYMIMVTTSVR